MRKCVVIAGGDVCGDISVPEGALLICADCGYRYAVQQGLHPDVLIGDMDSWEGEFPENCEILRYQSEKDETDTMLAVYCGRDRGCTEFIIYGAFGGSRPDHSFANIQMLHHIALQGLEGTLVHGTNLVTVQMPGIRRYPKRQGYLSLFSLTEECRGLTEKGVYYPLDHATLRNTFPLGVSNRITADEAEITLESGVLLVMQTQ